MATILVVEDNPDSMKLFRTLLRRRGHAFIGLEQGAGLVDTVRTAAPDLVLLDIQLPDRDGFSLLAELRAEFGLELRVVALTANATDEDRDQALSAGFNGFITKPIDIFTFPALVESLIEGAAPHPQP